MSKKLKDKYGEFDLYSLEKAPLNPNISVVMSAYNEEKYLDKSIQSILDQTERDFEFIIINDGSSDETLNILKKNQNLDPRIIIINQANIGLTKSLNRGVLLSKGNYIARQDADDESVKDRFKIQYNDLLKSKSDLAVCRTIIKESNHVTPNYLKVIFYKFIHKYQNVFIHGSFFMRKEVIKEVGMYNDSLKYSQDYDFTLKLLYKFKKKIYYNKSVLYISNKRANCISKKNKKEQIECSKKAKNFFRYF